MGVVDLIIGTPFPNNPSRMPGDPGAGNPEGEDWDKMVLMVVYENPPEYGDRFLTKELSDVEFGQLPTVTANPPYHVLSWKMPKGKVYVYGLVYNSKASGNDQITNAIATIKNSLKDPNYDAKSAIESMVISNDYAKYKAGTQEQNPDHIKHFLSLGTGYHGSPNAATPIEIIAANSSDATANRIVFTIGRLATKVDMQWDAQDAVLQGITQVRIKEVTFVGKTQPTTSQGGTGTTDPEDPGSGRLFPTLVSSKAPLITSHTFYNTSPVSQRNGRVYHYVFPDGVTIPKLQFKLSGKQMENGNLVEKPGQTYTITLQTGQGAQPDQPLIPGAWYKVNVTIKGFSGNNNITVKYPKDQSSVAGG